jgi:hypothetical protein
MDTQQSLQAVQEASPRPLSIPPQRDSDLAAYRYAKALVESARAASESRIKSLVKNWDWLVGKDHFVSWASRTALDQWQFRGVVNWTWSTIRTKCSILTAAKSESFVEPLGEEADNFARLLIKSATDHEADRTRFQSVKEKVMLSGAVTGIGVSMWSYKPDPLTGAMILARSVVPTDEFLRDPSVDQITDPNCRYVVWGPLMDMSRVREMFPDRAAFVKTENRQIIGGWTYSTADDSNLIYGSAGDYAVDKQGQLNARKARVYFVWVKDESVIEDIHKTLVAPGEEGFYCEVCNVNYPAASVQSTKCQTCGQEMEPTQLEDRYDETTTRRLAYPYGRLIVYSGDVLLYDGENPYEIEEVFPFSVYHHEQIPGDFYGGNDVELLQGLQDAQNRTVCQIIDYVRLGANAPTIYPVGFKALTELGNGPNQRLPGPDHAPWLPYKLSAQGFDINSVSALHNILTEHFQIVSGLASLGLGQTSSPPISATEAEIANARLSDRMRGHARALSQWATDDRNIQLQLMRQFYSNPVSAPVTMPDSSVKSIQIEVQKLPPARVRIIISPEDSVRDKLLGQNAMLLAQNGLLDSPWADLFMAKAGFTNTEIKEFLSRRETNQEIMPGMPTTPNLSVVPGGENAQLQPQ